MTATELFDLHVTRELSQYHGNLKAVLRVVERTDLPGPDTPEVAPHIAQLKRYLSRKGKPVDEVFLLWYGLFVPGISRGIEPPLAVLEPERGGFSDKRLMEAEGQISRLCQLLTLGRLLVPSLSTDPITAFRQIAERLAGQCRNDEAWVRAHMQLPETEAAELSHRALVCLDAAPDFGERILSALASLRSEPLGDVTRRLLARRQLWPAFLYRAAPESVAAEIVQLIENETQDDITHLVFALAWTRSESAVRFFRKWKINGSHTTIRPGWQAEDGPLNAGWCLDQEGNRRELISTQAYHLRLAPDPLTEGAILVPCRITADARCPNCEQSLVWLFDFTRIPNQVLTQATGFPRRILCCLYCSCYGVLFAAYEGSSTARWHSTTAPRGETGDTVPAVMRQLIADPYPPFAGAATFELDDASTIGGAPMWVQSAEYPVCPECKQFMRFIGQFDNMPLTPPEEGIHYAFFCGDCCISAVTYQQT